MNNIIEGSFENNSSKWENLKQKLSSGSDFIQFSNEDIDLIISKLKLRTSSVPIENEGDKISVGGKILIDRKNIQKLVGNESSKKETEDTGFIRKQSVSGRNAFEIRDDIVGKAMEIVEWSSLRKTDRNPDVITDEVLKIAQKLYKFVENKY